MPPFFTDLITVLITSSEGAKTTALSKSLPPSSYLKFEKKNSGMDNSRYTKFTLF